MPSGGLKAQSGMENAREVMRRGEAKPLMRRGKRSRGGTVHPRDFKNEDRTDYVYENKKRKGSLPEKGATFLLNFAQFCTRMGVFC